MVDIGRISRALRRRVRRVVVWFWVRKLGVLSRASHEPLTHPGVGPVVSLTSYGPRIRTTHLIIESIGRGRLKPSRLILWLDEEEALANLPKPLQRQRERGLEVLRTENYGPHKKYFPYVSSLSEHSDPLVTADDDVLYPTNWLEVLEQRAQSSPQDVTAYRARRVSFDESGLAPYEAWPFSADGSPSVLNFATGHSGVHYPPAMLDRLRELGADFLDKCPRADDIWLHWTALRTGRRVQLVHEQSSEFDTLAGTQAGGLRHLNITDGENDRQIRATYSAEDLRDLAAAHLASGTDDQR